MLSKLLSKHLLWKHTLSKHRSSSVLLPDLHLVLELAVHRVVLHLISEVLRVGGHVHHADHVELGAQEVLIADGLAISA